MRIIELFAGIGACSTALKRAGIDIEIVDAVEIDKYAMESFNAIHGTNFTTQDITEWNNNIKDITLITHGSPCQDFSKAGKQAGGDLGSGTKSSLMYETIRIIGQVRPKYVLWENVKNILSKRHKHNFDKYIDTLNTLGYNSYFQVLNAKDYGIPQNRERVYTISIRKDIDKGDFRFPEKEELQLRLKDILEAEVDEKYYLDKEKSQTFKFNGNEKGIIGRVKLGNFDYNNRIYGVNDVSFSLRAKEPDPKILIKNATKKGYLEANRYDGVDISSRMKYHRGNVQSQSIQTITTSGGNERGVVLEDLRIRKLTPLECWRLMGFKDEDFEKAKNIPISNTQLYKQAGNSIVVNVLEKIFRNLFKEDI